MGKITKSMQPKHKETLSPWLKIYVDSASTIPLPLLPQHLAKFPSRWPFPRGDLYHWIRLLNRFDSILEHFCVTYKLNDGPQERDFACDILSDRTQAAYEADEREWDANGLKELGFPADGDRQLVEAVLKFSRMLLEHCGNRSIYASSSHLNDLLNSTSLPILIATMEVGSELAQRYQASVKRIGTASRQISAALLGNHYNIDLDRVQQLALPFSKTPIISLADSHSFAPTGPASKGKDKEKAQASGRNAAPTHANDLVAIAIGDDKRWSSWGDVRVSYYPQDNASTAEASADQGHSSVPSTPTPLRRSSTMTTHHSTPRARHAPGEDSSPLEPRTPALAEESAPGSGQKWVDLPQSVVTSTPLYNLVNRCPKDMPAISKYEYFHRLRVAKALTASRETRQQLLALRLLAITNLAYIHTESNFVEKVLRHDMDETRRYQLVYQLAELIHPSADGTTDVPLWLQTIALALLAAVSSFMARCQDVLSALNANVNHGILLYVIRKAVAGMSEDDPSDVEDSLDRVTEADEWRNHLFALTLHLSTATRVGSEMVSAGLMEILVEMLNLRSKISQRHHSTVLGFLDGLVWNYSSPLTAFFNANGLDAMAKLVVDALDEAKSLREAGRGTSSSQHTHAVDYEIPYYQQQTLKWLLKFIHHIMSNSFSYTGNTDRLLRNLAEKSDLLGSLREIIGNKKIYGSVIWTNSVTILSDFINNDPTSFAAISESGMIKTYLEAITGRPLPEDDKQRQIGDDDGNESDTSDSSIGSSFVVADDRPHPPPEEELRSRKRESMASGILPSPDAMLVVPSVLNSISLNNAGMRMIVKSKVLDSFFEIFESAEHVRCMGPDDNLAPNLGASFDELARHHPSLRSSITNAVVDMIARVKYLGVYKSETAGWGAKLLAPSSRESNPPEFPAQRGLRGTHGDDDIDMSDAVSPEDGDADTAGEGRNESPTNSITPFIYAMAGFLSSYLNTVSLKTNLIDNGAIELLLDICESPSLPASFGDSPASRMLNSVVVNLIDHCAIRGLPSLLRRSQMAFTALQPLAAKPEALPPYFAPFLTSDTQGDHADLKPETVAEANSLIKALLNAQTFIKIASECFSRSRSHSLHFHHVNVYDYYLNLINSIGPVLRGVLAEEARQLTVIPQHWSFRHQPTSVNGSSNQANAAIEADGGPLPDVLNSTERWKEDGEKTISTPLRPSKQEKASARFQNYEMLRTLLHPMIPTTFPLFQALGKVLLPRREINQGDPYFKCRHLEIAKALADTVLSHLGPSVDTSDPTSKDFHYWIIMLHTIHEMLIHHPRPNDRNTLQVLLPVLLAFKELNGLTVLNKMLKVFADTVRKGPQNSPEDSSKSKVAAFGLKKILDLYFILANGKHINDANNSYHIHRQMDRTHQAAQIGQQIVVEFRAIIFPALVDLWDASLIEKVPDQTAKRLITTLKMICVGEYEMETIPRDKRVFSPFKYADARFNWASVRGVVEDLSDVGFPEDLVLEGVYRANGTGATAREYCRAHKAGKAGPHRHPIPVQDANTSALKEPVASGSGRESPNAADAADVDRMSVDGPTDVPVDIFGQTVTPAADDEHERDAIVNESDVTPQATSPSAHKQDALLTTVKDALNKQRTDLRENLVDHCLEVIRIHPDTAIEVSDFIKAVILRQSDTEKQEDVAQRVTSTLSSLSHTDEGKKTNAKCIASCAHLLALLLQDGQFFDQNIQILRERVHDYLSFLEVVNSMVFESEPPSWIPYILLILETLLRHDERPVPVKWKPPTSLDEEIPVGPVLTMRDCLVNDKQCEDIFTNLSTMLCTTGTDEIRATAILRVLVILTRRRQLAQLAGQRLHLGRLCLTARQFSRLGSERMKSARISSHIMTILRHIVEDDEIIKQIMRTEIKTDFPQLQRTHRQPEVNVYLRAMSHLVLRSPDLFVEVTNELLRFSRWAPSSEGGRGPTLIWKEQDTEKTEPTQPVEEPATPGIKESTEVPDKQMTDVSKQHPEAKRPVVESPDGVVHFLLTELVAFREVEDKEPQKESLEEGEQTAAGRATSTSTEDVASEGKDKKSTKPVFKTEDHPIYVYRCFLLTCLAELLQSYTRSKVEFINFKRSAPPVYANTPVKPRSSVLNYLIYDLLCQGNLSGTTDTIASKKKAATASHAQKVLVALVARTNERTIDKNQDKYAYEDEADLLFVRKFVLDTVLKAYERAPVSEEPLETRYSRMQCLAELMNQMIGEKDKDQNTSSRNQDTVQSRSQAQIRRLMYEKGYLDKLTSSIAEINLSYPGVKRAIKYILRVLRVLTDTAKELSHANILPSGSLGDEEDDYGSASSLSDLDDDREETPDLYRNSTLGMLEPRGEDDESEDESGDDDDEDMYGDDMYEEGYEEDMEVDYDEGPDSEDDEVLNEIGEIEGLPGDHTGLIEVDLDAEDDDEDDDEDDEDDDDEDSDEDEDDDMDSAEMDDMHDDVEIVDEDGNPITDDGNSAWESDSDPDDEGDPEAIDVDYEAEVQDEEEAHMHRLDMNMEATEVLLNSMAHVLDDGFEEHMDEREETYEAGGGLDEGEEDEEEEMDDEEYIYPDANGLIDDQGPQIPALGWDYMGTEEDDRRHQIFVLDSHRRNGLPRGDNRSPFPSRFPAGGRDQLSNFRSFLNRSHRHNGPNFEDGTNPLLRRREQSQDASPRHGHTHTFGLRLPDGIGMFPGHSRHGGDGSLSFLQDLFEFLPMMGRHGQPLHFHVTGPGGPRELRDIGAPRVSRSEQRREGWTQEPYHAASFHVDSTMNRYQEEMRLVFGANHPNEAARVSNAIHAHLIPAAIELEKEARASEAATQKRAEEARRQREEEERLAREAKEAEEKAERERIEAEEREAAERAAAEAAAANSNNQDQTEHEQRSNDSAMEGVESTDGAAPIASQSQSNTGAPSNEPRVMTVIRGEEVDVTELGIDPDYLAALPEEFREEVIAQTISSRRSQAREEAATGESTEVFQEFLDALPDELRMEIVQQERQEQRRRAREDSRRQVLAAASSRPEPTATEMDDPASILLTFPPELREQVLMDQGEDLMDQLPPELAAQARALAQQHVPITTQRRNLIRPNPPGQPNPVAPPQAAPEGDNKSHRRAVIQMLDKAGVATLLRLMFIAQQGSIRSYLFNVFTDVCENRQNRLEVVSSILQILQDGSTDMPAVERSFGQLSLKAKKHKDKDAEQKTPQSLKRTLTTLTASGSTPANSETSPLLIVQQCLDLLVELCGKNPHISWLFLTEHETVGSTLKRSLSRKGKSKDTRAHKFAINSLLTLLDRELVIESSIVMTHLADLLNRVTLPLQNLDRRRKEAEEASKLEDKPNETEATSRTAAPEQASESQQLKQTSGESATKEQNKDEAPQKKPRQLQPPVIPPANLTLVVRIFVARECSSKTFQNTISTIKNLSAIPGAKAIFGQELVHQAQLLSENILLDLDSLLPHIEKATSGTEIQGIALSKFSPGASEQNKLLRVLTALDHLFDGKRNKSNGAEGVSEGTESEKQNLVTSLYHNSTFSTMWDKLSACLKAIRQRESMLSVATILLPLIESLMVVCKNMTITDDPSQSQANKDMVLSSPPPETRTASLFFSFTEDHRRILNELVRHNPKLMSGTFALLVKNPKVLEFDNKRNYFNRSVHSRQNQNRQNFPPLQLSVRRDHVFHDSFRSLFFQSGDEIKYGKLNIRFHGEEGVDAGGVTREWFQVLARQMFDPNYALFIPVSSDRTTFHPNKLSGINDEHLMFFKFIGRIIGKALYEGRVLDCFFSRAVYKRILGKSVSVKDMESFDPDYYKSLCWMLDNDITDIITETFSVEDDEFGVTTVVDLVPKGRDIPVTDENKHEYVRLVVEHKLLASVKEQMEHFLKGFHDIIPAELISIFDEQELELLISGLPDIDIDDWKSNTEYHNYSLSSPQIQWFWRAVRSFDKEERAKLLQFVTGTSKVPLNGFKELEGMNGVNRFNIHRDYGNKDRLPTSHTCFNQLDIPEYESYDILRSQIVKAITAGSDYFGFA